jgi:hypothetical protein
MSMRKDRIRSVKWSKHRSSPHHTILTTARVGPYGIPYTIYIRRYHTRPTTLIPQVSYLIPLLGSQGHQTHRVTGSQGHQGLGSYTSTILGLHDLGSHTSYLWSYTSTISPGSPDHQGHQGLRVTRVSGLMSHTSYLQATRVTRFSYLIPHTLYLRSPDSHTSYLGSRVSYLIPLLGSQDHQVTRLTGSQTHQGLRVLYLIPYTSGLIPPLSHHFTCFAVLDLTTCPFSNQ